jgi:hypothetical protein
MVMVMREVFPVSLASAFSIISLALGSATTAAHQGPTAAVMVNIAAQVAALPLELILISASSFYRCFAILFFPSGFAR